MQNVLIVDSEGKNNKVLEIIDTLSPEVSLEQHFSDHVEGIHTDVETNCTLELLFGTVGLSLETVVDQSFALDAVEAYFLEVIANADENAFFLPNDLREAVVSVGNDATGFDDRFSELHVGGINQEMLTVLRILIDIDPPILLYLKKYAPIIQCNAPLSLTSYPDRFACCLCSATSQSRSANLHDCLLFFYRLLLLRIRASYTTSLGRPSPPI